MFQQSVTSHVGTLSNLANTAADRPGSIHDDKAAQRLGFQAAFVPGSVVGTKALMAARSLLGDEWISEGRYDLTFVSPVYVKEPVRESAELRDGFGALVQVEAGDGRLCCAGSAATGFAVPWDASLDGTHGPDEVLPGVTIGTDLGEQEFSVGADIFERLVTASSDSADPFRLPGGHTQLPPEHLHVIALQLSRTRPMEFRGVRQPGMWAGHALAWREQLLLDEPYRMTERIADLGIAGRTTFLTYEFTVFAADGREVAVGRHKAKWLTETTPA